MTKEELDTAFDDLEFQIDKRRIGDEDRKSRFITGWRDASIRNRTYESKVLQSLTWQNLGYRLGKTWGEINDDDINAAFEHFATRLAESTALFINGIPDAVLTEILEAQRVQGGGDFYIQPFAGQIIKMLQESNPSPTKPVRLYVSSSENLSQIRYTALIVGWKDKRGLEADEKAVVRQHFEKHQPGELNLFDGDDKAVEKAVNLIKIRDLVQLDQILPTELLRKVSDGLPLKRQTSSGGWTEVYDTGGLIDLPYDAQAYIEEELNSQIEDSRQLPMNTLEERLANAERLPERVQVISVGFRRNPDVIVAVLRRADGVCERCGNQAPFLRQSDGSPYLEVHHWNPLSQGGEDTIDNAAALCPNCHREVHFGQNCDQ